MWYILNLYNVICEMISIKIKIDMISWPFPTVTGKA